MRSSLYSKPEGAGAGGSSAYSLAMEEQMQEENEAMLGALGSSVQRMRAMAGDLHREVEEQNQLLAALREAFTTATQGVNSSLRGVRGVMGRYGYRHTALFGLAVFAGLYLLYYLFTRK